VPAAVDCAAAAVSVQVAAAAAAAAARLLLIRRIGCTGCGTAPPLSAHL
jgi:hypothetical protein